MESNIYQLEFVSQTFIIDFVFVFTFMLSLLALTGKWPVVVRLGSNDIGIAQYYISFLSGIWSI